MNPVLPVRNPKRGNSAFPKSVAFFWTPSRRCPKKGSERQSCEPISSLSRGTVSYPGGSQPGGLRSKKGTWDLGYQYRHLEGDAWYEEFTESDFGANYITAATGGSAGYRAGTNVKGHVIRAQYSPYDSFTFGITYWLTDLIDESPAGSKSGSGRLQVDAVLKF